MLTICCGVCFLSSVDGSFLGRFFKSTASLDPLEVLLLFSSVISFFSSSFFMYFLVALALSIDSILDDSLLPSRSYLFSIFA